MLTRMTIRNLTVFPQTRLDYAGAWNFGPDASGDATVKEIAQSVAKLWGGGKIVLPTAHNNPHEASLLRLDILLRREVIRTRDPLVD